MCGLTGLHIEVCKNIVLAGVKEVTLLDDKVISAEDLSAQFFLSTKDIGLNVRLSFLVLCCTSLLWCPEELTGLLPFFYFVYM